MPRIFHAAFCLLLAASAARADVIVLKSGRRITGNNAAEEGDRVVYETAAGRMSVRKELVERIERGPGASRPVSDEVQVVPHIERGDADIVNQAVRDGGIDGNYLTRLENDPQAESPAGANRVAIARHAAAQFELERGNLDAAVGHYRRALTFAPEHTGVLLSLSYLHLRRSEYSQALDYLDRANRNAPNSADVAKLLGWAYYGLNRIDQAVREWKRALSIREDADVQRALAKALRDQQVESEFREGETRHFTLRYHGGAAPQLAREILRTLEDHFQAIERDLDFAPPEAIGVILYTEQDFIDITRAPAWAGAVNDGRIRLPVQGLTSVTRELSSTLKHELTHSFVHQKTRGRAPVWVHEGVAQWLEGKRSKENAGLIVEAYDRKLAIPLKALERSFGNLPPDVAGYAYAWSLSVMEYVAQSAGTGDIARILDRMNSERSAEEAIRSILRMDYAELELETVKYLRRTYVQ